MELVNFKYDIKSSLSDAQVENGTLHAVVDNGELHLDYDGKRIKFSDIEVHSTEEERRSLLAPKPKFHYCKDSGNLWYKNGIWKLVGQQGATKTCAISVGTETVSSVETLEEGWLVKRVTFIPDTLYSDQNATIEITCGDQQLIPIDDLYPAKISDQYDSLKVTRITSAGKIDVSIKNATSGSGVLYIEYTIM